MTTFDSVWPKFFDKEYRQHYALSLLKRSVAFQIKTLRKKHCGSQAVLAERSQVTQGVVSRAEDQEYGNLTFNTVGRIAAGLDMAFIGRFVPWSQLARFAEELSEQEFTRIPSFEQEKSAVSAQVESAPKKKPSRSENDDSASRHLAAGGNRPDTQAAKESLSDAGYEMAAKAGGM